MMRILVTGAAGFIGFHLSRALLHRGDEVLGVDNLNEYYSVALKKDRLQELQKSGKFSFEKIDLADAAAVHRIFESFRPEAVVHLAAQAGVRYSLTHPWAYARSNLDGFLSVLEGSRSFPPQHLIFASSSSVYGANRKMPFSVHDNVDHPVSLYAATKKANELMAHTYSHLYGLRTTGLRFFTVYGPWGRPDMAYFSFTKAIIEGRPIDLFNLGEMERDFTYVDDVVSAVEKLIVLPPEGDPGWNRLHPDPGSSYAPYRIYNIGNHQPVKLKKFVSILEELIGKKAEVRLLPMQPGDVEATFADIDDLRETTGFSPSTDLPVGLRKFVDWYRDYYKV